MKKQIKIGVADSVSSAKDFIEAWKRAERGKKAGVEQKLNFENLETLLKVLTSKRWMLLKALRKSGPMSIRALSHELGRDYKNVHTDVRLMERMGLIDQTESNLVEVPWDTVEAQLELAA